MSKYSSAVYYQNNKERLQKCLMKTSKSFWRLQRKKWQYGCEQYKNLSENEKQRLTEYRKKSYEMWKNKNASQPYSKII